MPSMKSKIVLPKPYLSYSAASLWWKNKQEFRDVYYLNKPKQDTPYTIFGKELSEKLQANDPLYEGVPRFSTYEERIELDIDGVRVLSYLDCFDIGTKAFIEHKTSIRNKDGTHKWTPSVVQKHDQLPWYSLMVKEKYGRVQKKCRLVYMETEWKELGSGIGKTMRLGYTGNFQVFDRSIEQWERDRIRELIVTTAHEISEDYALWKQNN